MSPLPTAVQGTGRWDPPLAISSWSLHERISRGDLDIYDFPKFVRQRFKVGALEILKNHLRGEDDEAFKRLAAEADNAGARVVCLAVDNDFSLEEKDLLRECDRMANVLEKAAAMRVEVIRINPGIRGEGEDEEIAERVATGIRKLSSVARPLGMTLALENQQLFGMKPANMLQVMKLLDPPKSEGICLDFGNFYPEDMELGPAQLALYARHVHAKSYAFSADGKTETTINYPARLMELSEVHYSGHISVEWEGDDEDDVENVWRTIRLVRRCIAQL